MLNRNGLFGNRDEKLDDKGRPISSSSDTFGTGLRTGASTTNTSSSSDSSSSTPGAFRSTRDSATSSSASAPSISSPPEVEKEEEPQGSKLIVGPNIKLKGVEITDCDTLVVEGHVEATMDSRAIQIAQTGSFSGTVGIDIAEIRGTFNGELTVRKKLVIYSTGKVSGKVHYGKLVIEEGGEISGEIKTLAQSQDKSSTAPSKGTPAQPPLHV